MHLFFQKLNSKNTFCFISMYVIPATLRGKFIAIDSYLRKQEKPQMNNLNVHLQQLEKEEQTKPKVGIRKEIINIRAEINEIQTKKTIEKINETQGWFFKR